MAIYVTTDRRKYEEDVVLALSVHPASMDERAAVGRMLAAAEHRATR